MRVSWHQQLKLKPNGVTGSHDSRAAPHLSIVYSAGLAGEWKGRSIQQQRTGSKNMANVFDFFFG